MIKWIHEEQMIKYGFKHTIQHQFTRNSKRKNAHKHPSSSPNMAGTCNTHAKSHMPMLTVAIKASKMGEIERAMIFWMWIDKWFLL